MLLTITDVEYLGDYSLLCSFNNGQRRKVDLTPLLAYPAFADLRDGADIAPEYLYEHGVEA